MTKNEIKHVAIIGAGMMGSGIGVEFARFGYQVALQDMHEDALDLAMKSVREYLDLMKETELITSAEVEKALGCIRMTRDIADAVRDADHVVEAVPEDLTLKQKIFSELDEVCPPDVILATNSSTKKAEDCAAGAINHPERILITHYWHPAPFIPLVEVIGWKKTDPEILERTVRLLKGIRKRVVLQKLELPNGPAGWGNALQQPMEAVARKLIDEMGCDPHIVDDMIRFGLGRRLPLGGIFLRYDIIGLDFFYNAAEARGEEAWAPIKERVEKGYSGVKSGKGFYDWPGDSAKQFLRQYNLGLINMMKQDMERGDI